MKQNFILLAPPRLGFNVTVRDNNPAYGCTAQGRLRVNVDASLGQFNVLSPDGGAVSVNNQMTISWTTNTLPICSQVDILMSTDGGLTFPITLAENVDNSLGSFNVAVTPEMGNTTQGRVMVVCADNDNIAFFNISNTDFTVSCGTLGDIVIGGQGVYEEVAYSTPKAVGGNIYVRSQGKLIVTSTLSLSDNSRIIVERGGQLHVDGGILTYCGSDGGRWPGIIAEGNFSVDHPSFPFGSSEPFGPAIVLINNQGIIERAEVGVSDGRYLNEQNPFYFGPVIYCEDASFLGCQADVNLRRYKLPNSSAFINTKFDGAMADADNTSISLKEVRGIDITGCEFTQKRGVAVALYGAAVDIENECSFRDGGIGVFVSSASPGIARVRIRLGNVFDLGGNAPAILLSGADNILIEDNIFEGHEFAIEITGQSKAQILENSFEHNYFGIYGVSTLTGEVEIGCNDFKGADNEFPLLFVGRNDRSRFHRNFFGSYSSIGANVIIDGDFQGPATVMPQRGQEGDPARNCFTGTDDEHIWTFSDTETFEYYTLQTNPWPCEEPEDASLGDNNYEVNLTSSGVFEDCPLFFPEYETFGCGWQDYIDKKTAYDNAVNAHNNDPSSSSLLSGFLFAEADKNAMIRCIVEQAIQSGDTSLAGPVLTYEGSIRAREVRVGLRTATGDYSGAQQLLNTLPTGPLGDPNAQFRYVQEINLDRLASTDSLYQLDSTQLDRLREIAGTSARASGHARALLSLLAGERPWWDYQMPPTPALGSQLPEEEQPQQAAAQRMRVYPNPSTGQFTLSLSEYSGEPLEVRLINMEGRVLRNVSRGAGRQFTFDWPQLPPGLYIVEVLTTTRKIGQTLISIQ